MRALQVIGAVTIIALAGACSDPVDRVAGPAGPVVDGGSTSASPPAATSAAPATTPARTTPPASAATTTTTTPAKATGPCPVGAPVLYRALLGSGHFQGPVKPAGLTKPTCYQGYAYARTTYDKPPPGERNWFLFHYDHGWTVLNGGTADVCEGYVSADVRDHLNQPTAQGC